MAVLELQDLRGRVGNRAAMVSFGSSKRHKPEALNAWINEAIQQYELILTETGHPQRIARATVTTTAATTLVDGWPSNEFVELPSDFLELHRLTLIDGDSRVTLDQFAESETDEMFAQEWYIPSQQGCGRPAKYRLARYRDTDGSNKTLARLLPAADAAYTLELVYQPHPPVLIDDGDGYDFFPGTSDFVVCSAAMSVSEYDGIQEKDAYSALKGRRDECAAILRSRAGNQARGGVVTMQSTPRRNMRFGRRT